MWHGPSILISRWTPATLALTHLITLGYLGLTMMGALFQLLPVLAPVQLSWARQMSNAVFGFLLAGASLLPVAFFLQAAYLFTLALVCLSGALVCLFIPMAYGIAVIPATPAAATIRAVRLALLALGFAVVIGIVLGTAFAWPQQSSLPVHLLTELHVLWAVPGWVGLLIIGVAFQVVPMFMVTPLYAPIFTRWLAPTLFLLLLGYCTARFTGWPAVAHWSGVFIAIGYLAFATVSLILLARRTRPKADATTLFWRLAMVCGMGSAMAWLTSAAFDLVLTPIALGVLFIVGFAGSAVNGMLYKIVPFLLWYHAKEKAGMHHRSPSIKQLLVDASGRIQFCLHGCALMLLVAAALLPDLLARPAGAALAISIGLLELNLIGAVRRYYLAVRIMPSPVVVT